MALTLQHLRHRTTKILAIALLASTLSACNVTEIDITSDWDAKRLYEEARTATDDGDWSLVIRLVATLNKPKLIWLMCTGVTVNPLKPSPLAIDS